MKKVTVQPFNALPFFGVKYYPNGKACRESSKSTKDADARKSLNKAKRMVKRHDDRRD
jgi:hypothetical protein